MPHADVERGVSTVRAFRGMKRILIITIALFASCSTTKRTQPCSQCPQYTYKNYKYYYMMEAVKLSPYRTYIAYEKVD